MPRAAGPVADAGDPGWQRDSENRLIHRYLWASSEMRAWPGWSHPCQVFLVRKRQRHPDGRVTLLQDRFFITSMTPGRLPPKRALDIVRLHWSIENEAFGALDRKDFWAEDTTPGWPYTGEALENVSLLRCIAFNLVALFRAVHWRSDEKRKVAWRRLREWISFALRASDPGCKTRQPLGACPSVA